MSLKFPCGECDQSLTVGDDKIGRRFKCPSCQAVVTVPDKETAKQLLEERASRRAAEAGVSRQDYEEEEDPFQQFVVYDDDSEWAYEDEAAGHTNVDPTKLAVSRYIIYIQGALLGVVAIVACVFGFAVGRMTAGPTEVVRREPLPATVAGKVTVDGDPEENAIVMIFPKDMRPDEPLSTLSWRPESAPQIAGSPERNKLEAIQGDAARTNLDGEFKLAIPDIDRTYFILVISNSDSSDDEFSAEDLAEIGRYFGSAHELVEGKNYKWESEIIRGDVKDFNVKFVTE